MSREPPHPDPAHGTGDGQAGPSPVPGPRGLWRAEDAIRPALGAVVMASGVVSIDLHFDHRSVLSAITLWFAGAVWLLLAVVLSVRLAFERDRFAQEAGSPAGFTSVAGTAVLGTRLALADHNAAAAALLAISMACWLLIVGPILRHWKTPTIGISFILTVATESLAVLAAILAVSDGDEWLVSAAALALLLGLAFYLFTAARFDLRQLVTGHGDHWLVGGALAISALAAGHVTESAATLGQLSPLHQILTTGTLVLWYLAMFWLVPLIAVEILRPRPHYDLRRWATVMALAMYAASSFTTGQVASTTAITNFGHAWTWVALTGWLIALLGLLHHAWTVVRDQP